MYVSLKHFIALTQFISIVKNLLVEVYTPSFRFNILQVQQQSSNDSNLNIVLLSTDHNAPVEQLYSETGLVLKHVISSGPKNGLSQPS